MTDEFMVKANQLVRDELPYPDTYTAGWLDHPSYDLFIPLVSTPNHRIIGIGTPITTGKFLLQNTVIGNTMRRMRVLIKTI